jgi:uncharacterized Zn-binding protein involved in type VI secretion
MTQPFIVIGDKTSHGGTVVGGATTATTHGKQVARVGDKVTCPKCGSTTIATGDNTMIVMGQPIARHGDKTACGATLIAGQSVTTTGAGGGGGSSSASSTSATATPQPSDAQLAQLDHGAPDQQEASTGATAPPDSAPFSADKTKLVRVTLPGLGGTYLDASFKPHVEQFISNAAAHGVHLHFNSAYRSPQHQAALHNDPNAITPATKSLHSCGFAVDVNYSTLPESQRAVIRQAAKDAELKWGGHFHHPDPPHFYMDPPIDRETAIENATRQYNEMNGGG